MTRFVINTVQKPSFTPVPTGFLQRKCACGQHTTDQHGRCTECKKKGLALQRRAVNQNGPEVAPPIVHEVLRSPGRPLDPATRAFMELHFKHDFSRVQVHADTRATKSARAVNAHAFTVGPHVVFGTRRYAPNTAAGQRLLAHELAHVVQQEGIRSGGLSFGSLQIGPTNDAREKEADAVAGTLVSSSGPRRVGGLSANRAVVQRQLDARTERNRASAPFERRPGSILPYREATELAECVRIMGEENSAYCRHEVLGEPPPAIPRLEIRRDGGGRQTFISTDSLTFTAQLLNAPPGTARPVAFNWAVRGVSPNAGNGNPHNATNQARFTFRPNPTNRPTAGSRVPNDPIEYVVEAQAGGYRGSFALEQDETDIIRQEYIDHGPVTPPARSVVVQPAIVTFNTGNYRLIVDNGMNNALTNTEAQFQALTPAAHQPAPAVNVTSGYRNPQRNVAVGSNFPVGSRHVWGRALDLTVAGANATLWARLRQAGANAGNTSICEEGPTRRPCNDPRVDHVHIQW